MDPFLNTIQLGDCVEQMSKLPDGSVDLAFADPPFNIGYDYDVYDDSLEHQHYIDWSKDWISAVHRVLKPDGTFWLAIGDEYAAELKLASQDIGFHCRSWVVWYYTFGVNCSKKFTRSHAHLFHFVKDPENFTFRDDDLDNRVPSARELVYNDKRANSKGRLPDDTWIIRPADVVGEIVSDDDGSWSPDLLAPPSDKDRTFTLRPQDLDGGFTPSEDTWYFPRVAGTFKERAGFHGCQMPEQLLGRIIRACSEPGQVVLDPFSGSATTLAVAKKLGRTYAGFELSEDYVQYGTKRLDSICVGDRLDGSAEPLKSAPKTGAKNKGTAKGKKDKKSKQASAAKERVQAVEQRYEAVQLELTLQGVIEAFRLTHDGFSADRVVADPDLNEAFLDACNRIGIVGDPRTWNMLLFRLRKAGKLADIETTQRTSIEWKDCDEYLFASEIALQSLLDAGKAKTFDEILCDPILAIQFDEFARRLAPGHKPFEYRWAALRLRKHAKMARTRAAVLKAPKRFSSMIPVDELDADRLPEVPGLYLLSESPKSRIYVGGTVNLRRRLDLQFAPFQMNVWSQLSKAVLVQTLPMADSSAGMLTWQSCMVRKYKKRPRLNYHELRSS
jgi:site-specific DNA-methyltransferase (adenine-specific)